MLRIAKFEKVSIKQFVDDWIATFPQQTIEQAVMAYESIRLPQRATSGSAGYDFFAPMDFEIPAGASIKIPTGVRAKPMRSVRRLSMTLSPAFAS